MPSIITRGGMSAKALGFGASTSGPAVYVEDVFSTYLYTGTGASQTITNGIDLSTKGGLVWSKSRNAAYSHWLIDTDRGANNILFTEVTDAQANISGSLTGFTSTGFTLGSASINSTNVNYASWTFRKQPKFFDIVTYTGTGSAQTIAHNLGATPGMIIVKRVESPGSWAVYHKSLPSASYYLNLNYTDAQAVSSTVWNDTAPTSTVFSVGTASGVNGSGGTFVAYLFADSNSGGFGAAGTDSVVACGSFTTDGSGNATVSLGWEPQWVLYKQSSSAGQAWLLLDIMRGAPLTGNAAYLTPNTSGPEYSDFGLLMQPNATGFNASIVGSGGQTYIYLAIRRGPMKTPTDATKVFSPQKYTEILTNPTTLTTGWPTDLNLAARNASGATGFYWSDRLRGSTASNNALLTSFNTSAEQTFGVSPMLFDSSTGIKVTEGFNNSAGFTDIDYQFRRAPGFFDVVCYTGTGSATTVAHNLGVAPELMIVKRRNATDNWNIFCKYLPAAGQNRIMYLNLTDAQVGIGYGIWTSTAPTASEFSLGSDAGVNASGSTYVAYLFATCAGVSKVGSYTGTGAAQNIDCGFSSSARFILIKRTDSTGDWWVYDSARGISASNDPYLFMNSTAAEVTNTDYVNTYATGFSLTSSAPAGLNANGGSYIFLAIA